MPKAPFDPVPHYCRSHGTADHEPDQWRPVGLRLHQQVAGNQRPANPAATMGRRVEVGSPSHPRRRGKHLATATARVDQTLTRARPFRRLAARMARPARLRMRSRKPCVLARRRLFGWNVRLLTGTPDSGRSGGSSAPDQYQAALQQDRGDRTNTRYAPPLERVKLGPATQRLAQAGLVPVTSCATALHASSCAVHRTVRIPERVVNSGPRLWTTRRSTAD